MERWCSVTMMLLAPSNCTDQRGRADVILRLDEIMNQRCGRLFEQLIADVRNMRRCATNACSRPACHRDIVVQTCARPCPPFSSQVNPQQNAMRAMEARLEKFVDKVLLDITLPGPEPS